MAVSLLEILFSWTVVGAVVAALFGLGVGVMSMAPPEFTVARVSFTLSAIILLIRLSTWLIASDAARAERFIVAFALFGIIGVSWIESWRWVSDREHSSNAVSLTSPQATGPPTIQVYLEYFPTELPIVIKPKTQIFIAFVIQQNETIAFNLVPMQAPMDGQGQIITWNDRSDPRSMLGGICKLTNYSGAVLFDLDLSVSTEFHQAVRLGPDAFGPGNITATHDWTIRIPKIEADRQEPFVFYLVNEAQAYVIVTVLEALGASVVGQDGRQQVQLIRMTGNLRDDGLSLTPKDFTKLPQ